MGLLWKKDSRTKGSFSLCADIWAHIALYVHDCLLLTRDYQKHIEEITWAFPSIFQTNNLQNTKIIWASSFEHGYDILGYYSTGSSSLVRMQHICWNLGRILDSDGWLRWVVFLLLPWEFDRVFSFLRLRAIARSKCCMEWKYELPKARLGWQFSSMAYSTGFIRHERYWVPVSRTSKFKILVQIYETAQLNIYCYSQYRSKRPKFRRSLV